MKSSTGESVEESYRQSLAIAATWNPSMGGAEVVAIANAEGGLEPEGDDLFADDVEQR